MPMWRCPHCGTPQAETARCWVCRRSSTSCATCRHFRRSVAAQLGFCGLDRGRQPLNGDEIRGCWESWPIGSVAAERQPTIGPARPVDPTVRANLEFIEVTPLGDPDRPGTEPEPPLPAPGQPLRPDPGWSLWGDPER